MAFANPAARRHRRRARHSPLAAPLALFLIAGVAAVSYVGYVLWPRWPDAPVALGAPALPIVVAGAAFNIEPAAIRMPVQRHPGTQDRVDLAYVWPTLVPPDPAEKAAAPGAPIEPIERLFVTIEGTDGTMPPIERVETIYPRYLVAEPVAGPAGLTLRGFRKDTPYAGEELAFEFERATALPGALFAPRRCRLGKLPVGKAHRRRQPHLPISPRLAGKLAASGRRHRYGDGAAAGAVMQQRHLSRHARPCAGHPRLPS